MRLLKTAKIILAAALLIILSGCPTRPDTIEIRVAGQPFQVEIADTPELRRTGLMHRRSLGEDHGMLFVFELDKRPSFWMKNTLIPLSIAFISSAGEILEIRDMQPQDHTPIISSQPCRYALEVNQGAFSRYGIRSGDRAVFPW